MKIGSVGIPFSWHILLWLALGVLVATGTAVLLWWSLGNPALTGPNAPKPQEKFDLIKIALTVTGGIGGVIFLVISYRKQRLGEAAEQRENTKEEREDTKLFNERFTKAAEQLGHDAPAVRLAGVYAMAGLADDWHDHRQTCIDVLCAYLRMHYDPKPPDDLTELRKWHGERQVRHTVIRVITAHLRDNAPNDWRGRDFDFSGAVFDGGDFSRATFSGGIVNFIGATFCGSWVDFSLVTFSGEVDFTEATFSGGMVFFNGGNFAGGRVLFRGATFSGGTVDFGEATFSAGVNFSRATFSGGAVRFRRVKFAGGAVQFVGGLFSGGTVDFDEATFSAGKVNFGYAGFSGGTVQFVGGLFSGGTVDFSEATFSAGTVSFTGATFSGGKVQFGNAEFSGGTVDLANPRLWEVSPLDSGLEVESPAGLLLPETEPHPLPDQATSHD